MKRIRFILLFCVAVVAASCSAERVPEVKNVIYLIGDGMGFGAVSSLLLEDEQQTGFEMQPVVGLSETCSANNHVTDSPAGGTALACGVRTLNGYLGVDVNGVPLESLLKKAQKMGKKSGIVVNTTLTEATPAAFYAGVLSRSKSYDIAKQFVESGVDVAVGAGLSAFINRPDSVDLTETLIGKGYDVYLQWGDVLNSQSDRFVGILPVEYVHRRNKKSVEAGAADGAQVCFAAKLAAGEDGGVNGEKSSVGLKMDAEPEQYLEKAVAKAVDVLGRVGKEKGFFLMIESAIIDGYGHNNDSEGMIQEMAEFNRTLKFLVNYVKNNPNTLLVVTADHETGGTAVGYKSHDVGQKTPLTLTFSTKGHTGTVVPLFAYGEGAEYFGGVMKNTDIPLRIELLMNLNK